MKSYLLLSKPSEIYNNMIKDMLLAKKYIYLETHIFDDDKIGDKFKKTLLEKAKEGIKIKLLIDAWGSTTNYAYFKELIKNGAEVKFFREVTYIYSKYLLLNHRSAHERNHRKLLLVDDEITYIGSINITASGLLYRELALRLEGNITPKFKISFLRSWELCGKISKQKINAILYKSYEIIHEIPSIYYSVTEKKYKQLIDSAKKSIEIETPYFVPSTRILEALSKAVKRGVNITIIIPKNSEIKLVDILKERYLGRLHKKGINIKIYTKSLLHSKLMIVDNNFFILGSSNLDYRSFYSQHDINFIGKDKNLIKELKKYFNETSLQSEDFNFSLWKSRSSFKKLLEILISNIRHYL